MKKWTEENSIDWILLIPWRMFRCVAAHLSLDGLINPKAHRYVLSSVSQSCGPDRSVVLYSDIFGPSGWMISQTNIVLYLLLWTSLHCSLQCFHHGSSHTTTLFYHWTQPTWTKWNWSPMSYLLNCKLQFQSPACHLEADGRGTSSSRFNAESGFVRFEKTRRSRGILKWQFPGLEKSRESAACGAARD